MTLWDVFSTVLFLFCDILTKAVNLFIKRDKSIFLFGSDAGQKWGGNSRFLYQYLSENKEKYGLKKVIWVTRNETVYKELSDMGGYEVYMMHSGKSYYYHIKAGVFLFNRGGYTSYSTGIKVYGDVMGLLALGAKKVNLCHALFVLKENMTEKYDRLDWKHKVIVSVYQFFHGIKFFRHYMLYPGGMDEYALMSCARSARHARYKNSPAKRIESGYPELCPCCRLTKSEEALLNKIRGMHKEKIIIFMPTYRTTEANDYVHPLDIPEICDYIKKNNYLWIDKLHHGAQESMNAHFYDPDYTIKLDKAFDTNGIIPYVDMLITDYSTISVKGVYFDKPIVLYMPDYDSYAQRDKGIREGVIERIPAICTYTPRELINGIEDGFGSTYMEDKKEEYIKAKDYFFDGRISDYEDIMKLIMEYIND